jgi:hypothetical protein
MLICTITVREPDLNVPLCHARMGLNYYAKSLCMIFVASGRDKRRIDDLVLPIRSSWLADVRRGVCCGMYCLCHYYY